MYDIKLLGIGQAYYDGKVIPGFPGQRHCLLFYYLLLNRQIPHTREQVATVFWGDSPSSVARKNLRNTLWRLSQSFQSVGAALEDLITVQEDYIAFNSTGIYKLDIDEFQTSSRYSLDHASQELDEDEVSLLEKAVALYKSDFLEGVYEDWCLYERERLREAFLNILTRLMNHHSRNGNYEHALEYGQRILVLEPTRERVHRQMMVIHSLAGDREASILQYRSCCEILQVELGIEPMQETQHLYETILHTPSAGQHLFNKSAKVNGKTDMSSTSPLRAMLQKLHFLEMIVEQTNTELHLLERMIQQALEVK